jgi:hypothetical protein
LGRGWGGCTSYRPNHSGPRLSGPLFWGLNVAKIGPEKRTSISFRPQYFVNASQALHIFRIHLISTQAFRIDKVFFDHRDATEKKVS